MIKIEAEFLDNLYQALPRPLVTRYLRPGIQFHGLGITNRIGQDVHDITPDLSPFHYLYNGHANPLVAELRCAGTHPARLNSTHLGDMGIVPKPSDLLALVKKGSDEHHVGDVHPPDMTIIGYELIPFVYADIFLVFLFDHVLYGSCNSGHMHQKACGDQTGHPVFQGNNLRHLASLPDYSGGGEMPDDLLGLKHLLGQTIIKNLVFYRV